jgi:hypothetical protein
MTKTFKFIILLPNGNAINHTTKLTRNVFTASIDNEADLCRFIKRVWCKETKSKSFTDWANELNNSGEYEGTFTKYDALENLCGLFQVNIDGKHVKLYELFAKHLPFTNK